MGFSLWHEGVVYATVGASTGVLAGLFGIGGGLLLVPALIYLFEQTHVIPTPFLMQVAAGTSLAIMIFTALAAIIGHLKQGGVLWHIYQRLWPGIAMGTVAGSWLAHFMPTAWLEKILGVVLFFVLIHMVLGLKKRSVPASFTGHLHAAYVISALIGLIAGLVGIGGGAMVIPYLSYQGIEPRKISALSSACTLVVALVGSVAFVLLGSHTQNLPDDCVGYIYWPAVLWMTLPSMFMAPIGAKLTYYFSPKQLKYAFIVLLFLIAMALLFS